MRLEKILSTLRVILGIAGDISGLGIINKLPLNYLIKYLPMIISHLEDLRAKDINKVWTQEEIDNAVEGKIHEILDIESRILDEAAHD